MRFHIPGLAHTVTEDREWNACAFTQKVFKLCSILKNLGHTVYHYGHERSKVDCTEHVTVTNDEILEKAYGKYDWKKTSFKNRLNDYAYTEHAKASIREINLRKQKNDFLLLPFGWGHKAISDGLPDLISVESGVGYRDSFARFRIFESYALMHACHGLDWVQNAVVDYYMTFVVPNHFNPDDFSFSDKREDWLLYLGRINVGKGLHIIIDATRRAGKKLVVAGQGDINTIPKTGCMKHVEFVGYANREKRKELMCRCGGLVILSQYLEPFGGVVVEAMMSGAPVVTSDWGAFPEINLHGITGYRTRAMEQIVWALQNTHRIDPKTCRKWAVANFSNERIGLMYNDVFRQIMDIFDGSGGWYAERKRGELDWLTKYYP
ncbi:MAG: glycosyltransferase [Bacteroidetes bacterium]|nr:glycosyltransferase [Bacteroidota bacterium]